MLTITAAVPLDSVFDSAWKIQVNSDRIARDFWRRADACRHDFASGNDASGFPILPRHPREPEARTSPDGVLYGYACRKAKAKGRPYVKSIVDKFRDGVIRPGIVRPTAEDGASPAYLEFQANANGHSLSLAALMPKALRVAQVEGSAWLLCDASEPDDATSKAEETAMGKRAVLRLLDGDAVVWWQEFDGDVIAGAVVMTGRDGERFLWEVDETSTRKTPLDSKDTLGEPGEAVPHGYGGCPLVRLRPDACAWSESQAAPIADCQVAICELQSWLREELANCAFTTPVFLGTDPDALAGAVIGPGIGMAIPAAPGGQIPSLGKLGSDPAQAESIRKSIDQEIREMYRSAGINSGNPTEIGQPESGVAKAFAFADVATRLDALARAAEKAENRAVFLLSNAFWGGVYPGDARWPSGDDFEPQTVAGDIDQAIRCQTGQAPKAITNRLWRDVATDLGLSEDESKELDEELSSEPETNPANPFSRTGT